MNLARYKPQNLELVRRNQPDLYSTLKKVLPTTDDQQLGIIAGLVIEYVIQAKGNVDIFGEEDLSFLTEDNEF
jgi:hypothetical protein